ncbi:hypothetical protein [Afipia sp. GAS231]|uniref:hypothetical protein n=1 Tax=Afipia sp. GAS231 TaxID=1882747 RepID=UPI0012FCF3E7|nr:hypothetical protein [Afipia sp. GAS231]
MKRNLYSGGHRRPGPEADLQQGATAPYRPAPRRHRADPQRRELHAAADERSPGAQERSPDSFYSYSSDRPRRNGGIEHDDQLRTAEQHQKVELQRLREEVLDIARELKGMQRLDTGRSGAKGFDGPSAREFGIRTKSPAVSHNVRPTPSQVRPPELRPQPAQPDLRAGTAEAKTKAAPARAKTPPPLIVPGVRKLANKPATRAKGVRLNLAAKAALVAVLMLAGTAFITMKLWGEMPWLTPARQKVADMLVHVSSQVSWPVAKAAPAAPSSAAPVARQMPAFAAPDTYGVYAVSDGQLTPLEPLPIRVPDARVSISSTISKPAPAPLANGHLSFVVYHRELATSVPETASVRIVAKVMQATAFAGGKPKSITVEDTWAVRGGAVDLRIAPVPANSEMIVIRAADPNFTLSPGRYVLMFKNQAYDFSVAGTVSDTAQCLERADLQDRSVYSECRELPAQPVSF